MTNRTRMKLESFDKVSVSVSGPGVMGFFYSHDEQFLEKNGGVWCPQHKPPRHIQNTPCEEVVVDLR